MKTCDEIAAAIHPYVDGELSPADTLAVEAHLMDCGPCRDRYESLMSVVGSVRGAHPLYPASAESYENAQRQIRSHGRRQWARRAVAAASILLAAAVSWLAFSRGVLAPDPFSTFAAEAHVRYSRGALPLDLQSTDPRGAENWLGQRLPFHVTLPDYPAIPGKRPYTLVGARLLQYRDEDAVYLAYEVDGRPVSLVIASSAHIIPRGKARQRIGRLTFYDASYGGLNAISWVDKDLSYVLVSDLGAESCVICHGAPADRRKFLPLKPRI